MPPGTQCRRNGVAFCYIFSPRIGLFNARAYEGIETASQHWLGSELSFSDPQTQPQWQDGEGRGKIWPAPYKCLRSYFTGLNRAPSRGREKVFWDVELLGPWQECRAGSST